MAIGGHVVLLPMVRFLSYSWATLRFFAGAWVGRGREAPKNDNFYVISEYAHSAGVEGRYV